MKACVWLSSLRLGTGQRVTIWSCGVAFQLLLDLIEVLWPCIRRSFATLVYSSSRTAAQLTANILENPNGRNPKP